MKIFSKKLLSRTALAVAITALFLISTSCGKHEHTFSNEWSTDEENHWYAATCKHSEEKSELGEHEYDNDCDTNCNVCEYERTAKAHVYDNDCDAECNACGAKRDAAHKYDSDCDANCNVCEAVRTISHSYGESLTVGEETHYYLCSVCGDKKDEAAHVFDKTVAHSDYLKSEAVAGNKAQYYKSCVCGKASATEYFETDKTAGTLANVQDLSKTYDKVELANPTYETNSDGAVTIEWYQGDTKLDAKPVNAGTYKVKVIIVESATYTGISAEKEFTIAKKTLNYLELTKVYDAAGFIAYALGTEHGVVSGDVVVLTCEEEFDYYAGSYYFIDKTDDISLTDAGIDRAFLSGADAGNYQFANQKVSGLDKYEMGGMLTVTKRPVWAENVKFTYDGYDTFCGDEYPIFTLQNVVSGETIDLGDVSWCFDSKNVGATLTAVELSEEYNPNYTIDFSKCSASIIPRVIDNLTYAFEYNGMEYRQAFISKNEHSDIVGADEIALEVCFATPNVGALLDTSEENGFEPGFDEENYVLGTTYEFSIIPREIWVTGAQFYYDGYATTMDDVAIDGITIHNAATEDDEFYMGGFFKFWFENSDVGSNLENVTLEIEGFSDNYTINASKCEAEIVPMELTNLKVQITESTFEGGWAYLNATNGVVHGDKVYIEWTESGHSDTMQWKERGSDLVAPHTGTAIQGQAQVTLKGADAHNYTLVIKNNTYGRMEYSEKCKPDVYGYCACGEEHIAYTFNSADTVATVPVGPAGGKTWEGGIYALYTTAPGYWNIEPNDNYCTVTVYNRYGYKVTMKGFEFYAATAGTYYVHIAKNSEPASGDVITFRFAYELKNNDGSYVSQKVNCESGSYYYFKIDADAEWGASLDVMDGNGTIMDSSKYTVKIYDQSFIEMTDVIYDGVDIYKEHDDDFSVTDKLIYIQITVNVDTELCISAF